MFVILATVMVALAQVQVPFEERDLGRVPADLLPERTAFSPRGKILGVFCRRGDETYAWIGDRTLGPFVGWNQVVLNRDGSEMAFAANRGGVLDPKTNRINGGRWTVYRGTTAVHEAGSFGSLSFSPDGKTLVFMAKENGRESVVIGDQTWPACDDVAWIDFGSEGPYAYVNDGGKRDQWGVMRGGTWAYQTATGKRRAPEGSGKPLNNAIHGGFAYVDTEENRDKGLMTLIRDGKVVATAPQIWNLKFAPDGFRLGYAWGDSGGQAITVTGPGGEMRSWPKIGDFAFHPDSTRVAYVGKETDTEAFAVFDGKQGEKFNEINTLTWSPDGKSLAYLGYRKTGDAWETCLVVAGVKTPFSSELGAPYFSADSRKIAFGERKDRALRWRVLEVRPPEEPKLDWDKKVARTPKPVPAAEPAPRPAPATATPKPATPEIRIKKAPFDLTIPAGYVVAPVMPPKASYAYMRTVDEEKELQLAISLELMGGTLSRGDDVSDQDIARIVAKHLPPGAVVKRRKETWKNLEIDVIESRYTVGGVRLFACGAQVPLMPEAIQIFVGGQEEIQDLARKELTKVLATVQGRSNWLSSDERQSAFWAGGLALTAWMLFLVYGICAITVFREEPTKAWTYRAAWLGAASVCFAVAFIAGLSYAESRGRDFTSFLLPVASVAAAALAVRMFLRGRAGGVPVPATVPTSAPAARAARVGWTSMAEAVPVDRSRPAPAARPVVKPHRPPESTPTKPGKRPLPAMVVALLTVFGTGLATSVLFHVTGGGSMEAYQKTMEGAGTFGLFLGIIAYVFARGRMKRWELQQRIYETREKVAQKTTDLRCKSCDKPILSTNMPWQKESYCSEQCRKAHAGG